LSVAVSRLGAVGLLGCLSLALGIVLIAVARGTDEEVNRSGFVPGVAAGFIAIAVGGLGLILARRIREERYGRALVVFALMVWLAASTFLFVWVLDPDSVAGMPRNPLIVIVILIIVIGAALGFIGTLFAVGIVLGLVMLSVLAWLTDRIPALRRRNVGDPIRRNLPGSIW